MKEIQSEPPPVEAVAQAAMLEKAGPLIVGIGASAGGLAAFRVFFAQMPADSGMAFVLVQHLDPDYNSVLAEILSDSTAMPVAQAADGTLAAPNTVSVIPPNAILKIERGVLRIAPPDSPTARRSSIDTFLLSLAEDQGDCAVGIILSGFGSDGTIGIAAIKEGGGLTLSEAEFDHHAKKGMPRSAVAGGFVDKVLQVHEMPAALLEHQRYRAAVKEQPLVDDGKTDVAKHLMTICAVLHSRLGRDFAEYKPNTLLRRVQRRMQVLHAGDIGDYIEQLRTLPNEPELLFQELLIGVTRFFRDPTIFEALGASAVSEIVAKDNRGFKPIRIWVAGCATGEEAYSIAILFREALLRADAAQRVTIFATDIDERAVNFARAGVYSTAIEADMSAERLASNFVKEGDRYRVTKQIRDMCVFSSHDLVKDPPFSKLDLISCRNLLIYFGPRLQKRVVTLFHYGLVSQGALWLGPSEAIAASARLFKPIDKQRRLFKKQDVVAELPRRSPSPATDRSTAATSPSRPEMLDHEIARVMAQFAPAYLIVDSRQEVLRFSGSIARFLEPVSGNANLNLFRLLHAELRSPVRALLRKAHDSERGVQESLAITIGGQSEMLIVRADPMAVPIAGEHCVLVTFQEVSKAVAATFPATPLSADGAADPAQRELTDTRERLQNITEELATANEELQSSNEEFQSVNEELHSTVEELETSKEELQSINEELHTVNAELSNRADSLVRINSDLSNLFDSTSIATMFLDNDCRIRRFTPAIAEIFTVRDGDEGRPVTDFSSRLADGDLSRDIQSVLRTLNSVEREVESADGASTFLLRVRPYRALNNVIDGTVVSLIDITERKLLESDRAHLASIVKSSEDAIISHDLYGVITSWNQGAQAIYGYTEAEMIGQPISTLLSEHQLDDWSDSLARLNRGEAIASFDVTRVTKGHRRIHVSLTISPIRNEHGEIVGASAVARNIAERKAAEERSALLVAELDHRVKNILAVVRSVVSQTLRAAGLPDETTEEIEGRINAIARAQGLLTGHGRVEGSLSELIATELAPYEHRCNVTLAGDDVVLTSRAGLILALAIHELATNAAKYGALSVATGQLEVNWRVASNGSGSQLAIVWQEKGGPPVTIPSRKGFGTKLIELSLVRGLGAEVQRDFLNEGVHCRISMPLTEDLGRLNSPDSEQKT